MLGKINRALEKLVGVLIGLMLLWITLLLCFNVITRYGFGYSLSWAEEMTTYNIIWITFLGSGLCVRKGLHVCVDAFVQFLPPKGRFIMRILANLIGFAFAVLLAVIGWVLTQKVGASGQLSPAMMLPMKFAYVALPMGAVFMVLEYAETILELIFKERDQTSSNKLKYLPGPDA